MILNFKKIIIVFILFAIGFFAVPTSAATFIFEGIDCITYGNCTLCDVIHTIVNITDMVIAYSGLLAVVMIIFGGVLMLTAWGQEPRVALGKKTIIAALVGIFIVFIGWTVINTIIMASVGGTDGGFKTITGGTDWSKCPEAGAKPYGVKTERDPVPAKATSETPPAGTPATPTQSGPSPVLSSDSVSATSEYLARETFSAVCVRSYNSITVQCSLIAENKYHCDCYITSEMPD